MKRSLTGRCGAACLGLLLLVAPGLPALAHHSFALFDLGKEVTVSGTVKELQWTNPHCWIQLLVPNNDSTVEWSIEMGSPLEMLRGGWRPTTIKPGDKIEVTLHPLRDGKSGGSFVTAKFADGRAITTQTK